MTSAKRRTLAGRILRGVGLGIVDAVPFVAQVVNSVRDNDSARSAAVPSEATPSPVARTITGWVALSGIIVSILHGSVDCDALNGFLGWLGVPGF